MPTLRFTPYAWSKLLFLRDVGDTEVGGFGISAADDLFLVEDVRLVRQRCTQVTVEFDDEAVADHFDEQVDLGRLPHQVGRAWIHTHPGQSAEPSGTDEETFARAFGGADWAVMMILAKGGASYARLRFGCGPGAELLVPVAVDWDALFAGADHPAWAREYDQCVQPVETNLGRTTTDPVYNPVYDPEELAFYSEYPEMLDDDELRLLTNQLQEEGYDDQPYHQAR